MGGPPRTPVGPRMSLVPGSKLDPYEIVAPLNAGSMGAVWRAEGREIFYLGPDSEMMAVPVTLGPRF